MKKIIIISIILLILTIFISNYIYTNRNSLLTNFNTETDENTYYFIEEGVYDNKDIIENNFNKTYPYIIDYSNNKFYVYLGITNNLEVSKKLEEIYLNHNINVKRRNKKLTSSEFYNNIIQFDLLIKATSDEEEILKIEEVVLANYEEMIKNN
jgi:hypothetical protein